jgi:sortase A
MSTMRAGLPALTIRRGPDAVAVVRALARTVLVVGVLVAGFVIYQFGVTSFLATRAQTGLQADVVARAATAEVGTVSYVEPAFAEAPFTVPDIEFDPASVPWVDPIELVPTASATVASIAAEPVIVTEAPPPVGDAIGRIVIPAAGVDWAFVEGVTRTDLKAGAGHMPETALPGQPGNAVISGHRTTYGAPFLHLDRLSAGDMISVDTATGTHVYQVVETLVVEPGDIWVTGQWDGAWLTLTTCEPVLSSSERLVVVAALVAGPNAGVILDGS